MRPTPRTDQFKLIDNDREGQPPILVHGVEVVPISIARELELALNDANELIKTMQSDWATSDKQRDKYLDWLLKKIEEGDYGKFETNV